jgi:hypothetical protein
MRVLLAGGTGLVGRALATRLPEVTVLTRDALRATSLLARARPVPWPEASEAPPDEAFQDVEAVVNLAGDSIGEGRWTRHKKERIRSSRVVRTHRLVAALARLGRPPRVLVSASAMGYYGDRGDDVLTEEEGPGTGFLAELARDWEAEAEGARRFGARVVRLRTALVLGREAPAITRFGGLFRWGLGGKLGSGRQWMSWIHLEDLVALILRALEDPRLDGAVNAGAPEPVTNAEFTRLLAATLRRPAILPAPAFALRLVLGEFAGSLLASVRMAPEAALRAGFRFRYPDLAPALADIFERR